MTKEEIEEMAELSGLYLYKTNEELIYCLTYFAKLVAEKEREECAKLADEYANGLERNYSEIIADKIRARGNNE